MKKLLGLLAMAPMAVAACGGSASDAINIYTRDTSSGTREGFFSGIDAKVAQKDDAALVSGAVVSSGNGNLMESVKGDENGIGYISLTTLDSTVKGLDFNGIEATEDNVLKPVGDAGRYGLARTFSYITVDNTVDSQVSKLVAEFHNFVSSREGITELQNAGVIIADATDSTPTYDAGDVCTTGAKTEINIGGSNSVSKAATAITTALMSECGNFDAKHDHQGSSTSETVGVGDSTMHIGFSSSGQRPNWTSGDSFNPDNIVKDLGQDAIVAIVNKSNSIDNLTTKQLQQIFVKHDQLDAIDKNITSWADLA